MPSAAYVDDGSTIKVNGEVGADVAWSVEGLTNGAGRVSAQKDWGVAPRAPIYYWECEVQLQATPTQYATLTIYCAEADSVAGDVAGDEGTTDSALGDVDSVRNMKYVGVVVAENAAASEVNRAHGEFVSFARYHSYVIVNNSGATVNATDSNFVFKITPKFYEGQ